MTSLTEILENERGGIKAELLKASSAEEAQIAAGRAFDRLLYRFAEDCESERLKKEAAHFAEIAKAACAFADTAGEPEVWEKELPADVTASPKKKGRVRAAGVLIALLGLVASAAGIVLFMNAVPGSTADGVWELPLGLLGGGALLFFIGGVFLLRAKERAALPSVAQKAVVKPDPDKLYRALQASVITMDRQLGLAEQEEKAEKKRLLLEEKTPLPMEELELFSGLIEAAGSDDADYAKEKIGDVSYFLHNRGVEMVEYTPEHEEWFELLPSDTPGTMRPALVSGGRLLVKGLAAGGV